VDNKHSVFVLQSTKRWFFAT